MSPPVMVPSCSFGLVTAFVQVRGLHRALRDVLALHLVLAQLERRIDGAATSRKNQCERRDDVRVGEPRTEIHCVPPFVVVGDINRIA
jgi:hypothetical protein